MTKSALKKLEWRHKDLLEIYSIVVKNHSNPEYMRSKYSGMIKGYLNCLMTIGIITLKDREILTDYYIVGVIVQ